MDKNDAITGASNTASSTTTFRGLVIVVSLLREISEQISDYIAKQKLDNARRINNINKEINTMQDVESFMIPTPLEDDIFNTATSSRGGGAVCSAVVEDGITSIRKKLRHANIHNNDNKNKKIDYEDFISIMIYGCSSKDVEILYKEKKDQNRINGMLKGWKNTNCCQILEVTANEEDVDNDNDEVEKHQNVKNYENINQTQEKQQPREKITGPNDINNGIVLATTTATATDKKQENERKGNDVDEQEQNLKIINTIESNKQFGDFIELIWKMSKSVPEASIMERDTRPGMLFYFPASLPGYGKSTLLGSDDTVKQKKIKQSIISSLNLKKKEQEENKTKENPQQKQQDEENQQPKQRDIIFKEGDVTKGKYWVAIREERKLNSSSIYFADKNVPATSWSYIGQVCAATKAIAIPIIPGYYYRDNNENLNETLSSVAADAAAASMSSSQLNSTPLLHTTIIPSSNNTGGEQNNKDIYYPFPLHYLAICMTRVVDRKGQSHKGKLDMDTKYACLIVLDFFSFYSGISAVTFHERLRKALTNGCHATVASSTRANNNNNNNNEISSSLISSLVTMGRPIIVPFLRLSAGNSTGSENSNKNSSNPKEENSNLPDLPKDLEDILKEALRVMYNWKLENINIGSLDKPSKNQVNDNSISNSKNCNKQIAEDLEARLRRCIRKHKEFMLDLAVAEEVSRKEMIRQITKQIMELDDVTVTNVIRSPSLINIASIDVPVEDVHTLVLKELLVSNEHKTQQEQKEEEAISLFSQKSISNLLSIIFSRKEIDDDTDLSYVNGMYVGINEFVSNTHVTMVHYSQLPQECIHSLFDDLLGCQVNVKVTGVLWAEHIAALAVDVSPHCNVTSGSNNDNSNGDCIGNNVVKGNNALEGKENKGGHLKAKEILSPRNPFPHITLWHKTDVKPVESNNLPQLVQAGKAQQIRFPTPVVLQGTISYWEQ